MLDGVLNQFNRGEIDEAAFAREEVDRVQKSATLMENWLPLRLGAMTVRPGLEMIGEVETGARLIEYIYDIDSTALLEFRDSAVRVWLDGETLMTRSAVTTSITNGDFSSSLTGWTNASGSGSSASVSGSKLRLTGSDTTDAVIHQTLTTETGVENAIKVVVEEGPVRVNIGTSGASSSEITSSLLRPGTHSLVFTPDLNVTVTLINENDYRTIVDEVSVEGAGTFELPTDYALADVDSLHYAPSAGRVYFSGSAKPFVLHRRGVKSWGIASFDFESGPFDTINLDEGLTLRSSALGGNVVLTASKDHFKDPESIGTLRRLVSTGQDVSATVSAQDNGTDAIKVTGVGEARRFSYVISGSFTARVTLQQSADNSTWVDIDSWTGTRSTTYKDEIDNGIYYYRLHVKSGEYTSGTISLSMTYSGGGIEGIARITSVTSDTIASAQVLQAFGSTDATKDWYQTQWGDGAGYPNACILYEGRLVFAGREGVWGSVSDLPESFDRDIEGASASFFKTIGFGPVSNVSWLAVASRIGVGVSTDVIPLRSSSFGEVLTADNANLRPGGDIGAGDVQTVRLLNRVFFADTSKTKIYEMSYQPGNDGFVESDTTTLNQSILDAVVKEMAVVSNPEPRKYVVLDDGEARVRLFDVAEDVRAWSRISVEGGEIKRVATLRANGEDRVFFVVAYGGTEYLCRLAKMTERKTYPVDLYSTFAGPVQTLTGLDRFNGVSVGVWSDGDFIGNFTPSSGSVDLGASYSDVVAGLEIEATYKSGRLSARSDMPTYFERKAISHFGIKLKDFWHSKFELGPAEDKLEALPAVLNGMVIDTTSLVSDFDAPFDDFNTRLDTTSEIVLRSTGPATCYSFAYRISDGSVSRRTS